LSANQEITFPDLPQSGNADWVNEEIEYEIYNWFKRCIEDFPVYLVIGRGDPWTHREYEAWFKKWFSQFKEETK